MIASFQFWFAILIFCSTRTGDRFDKLFWRKFNWFISVLNIVVVINQIQFNRFDCRIHVSVRRRIDLAVVLGGFFQITSTFRWSVEWILDESTFATKHCLSAMIVALLVFAFSINHHIEAVDYQVLKSIRPDQCPHVIVTPKLKCWRHHQVEVVPVPVPVDVTVLFWCVVALLTILDYYCYLHCLHDSPSNWGYPFAYLGLAAMVELHSSLLHDWKKTNSNEKTIWFEKRKKKET